MQSKHSGEHQLELKVGPSTDGPTHALSDGMERIAGYGVL